MKQRMKNHRSYAQNFKDFTKNNRGAFFKTVVTFALPSGKVWSVKGEVEGIISDKPYLKLLQGYPYRSFSFYKYK